MGYKGEIVKVCIKNKTARVLRTCTGKRLLPSKTGRNDLELPIGELNAIIKDPQFKSWQRLNWVVIVKTLEDLVVEAEDAPEEVEEAEGHSGEDLLSSMSVPEAKLIIAGSDDMDLLESWHKKEKRKTLIAEIENKITSINEAEDSEEEIEE